MERVLHITVEKKSRTDASVNMIAHMEHFLGQWQSHELPAAISLFDNVDSTLDVAWDMVAHTTLPIWGSVLAQSQNQGRGQTRRQWHSPAGNIYAALRLPYAGTFLTSAASIAFSVLLLKAFARLGIYLQLKWPNDLVIVASTAGKAQKVGGILLEERNGVLMAGIGINLMHAPDPDILRKDFAIPAGNISIPSQILHNICRNENHSFFYAQPLAECLWLQLVKHMYLCYKNCSTTDFSHGDMSWKEEAEAVLLWKNTVVQLHDDDHYVCGVLQGLNELGELGLLVDKKVQYFMNGSLRCGTL